jgi:4-amino-4-deoxy-L-arabinose transferase-like glycosyltransferase
METNPPPITRSELLPAVLILASGLAALALRPALPIDETRYLEVLRESFQDGPWLLELSGEPYADKPALLFWMAKALSVLGPSAATCMRLLPALVSALLVLLTGRLGRRLGVPHAGWVQATLLMPFLYSQIILFDPLLSLTIWMAVAAWARERQWLATLGAGLAFLAKGPVAALFLALFFWAVTPLRTKHGGAPGRALLAIALGILPLGAWALLAANAGGEEFARDLLWDRWAGRVGDSFAHQRPFYFFVPILLLGSLPCSLLLFGRLGDGLWRRLLLAVLALFVIFSAMSGKQPHYLLPVFPALALVLARRLDQAPRTAGLLRGGTLFVVALLTGVLAIASAKPDLVREPLGVTDRALGGAPMPVLVAVALLAGVAALGLLAWRRRSVLRTLQVLLVVEVLALAPVHLALGRLAYPHDLGAALAELPPSSSLVLFGSPRGGIYNWLSGRPDIERLRQVPELEAWAAAHPGGHVVVDEKHLDKLDDALFERVLADRLNGDLETLFRVRPAR